MNGRAIRLYSAPAFAFCSLFGGPLSAVAFATIQSRAMGRLRRDLPWLLLGLASCVVAAQQAATSGLLREALADLGTQHVPAPLHLAYRVAALVFFYLYWRLQRPHRERLLRAGVKAEPGYAAGVVALLLGLLGGTLLLISLR
jgi:hypothetical protein